MSQRIVIHFNTLTDLLSDVGPATGYEPVIRVTTTQRTQQRSSMPIAAVTVATDVRAVTLSGAIANYRAAETVMVLMHHDPEGKQRLSAAWDHAEAVATEIRAYLTAQEYEVRAGVVDLGDVLPVPGNPWVLEA